MLAVNAASMKFFRVVSCFSLFKKNPSVTSFTDALPSFTDVLLPWITQGEKRHAYHDHDRY